MKTPLLFLLFFIFLSIFHSPCSLGEDPTPGDAPAKEKKITLDFNNVDLPVLVKFFSELTGKNFIIDEKVKGKVTVFSPTKMTVSKAYEVFLSVLDMKGFTTIQSGEVVQILPASEVPAERELHVYALSNASAEELSKTMTSFLIRPVTTVQHPRIRGQGDFEGQVQVFPDKTTNALVVYASSKDFEILKEVIQKFDQAKKQVYVEAVIMEVAVSKLRTLGIELANLNPSNGVIGATNFGSITNLAVNGPGALANSSGLFLGAGTGVITSPFAAQTPGLPGGVGVGFSGISSNILDIKGLLQALEADSEVNVLSTPQILASNFQKARIVVGQNIPFPIGSSTTPGGVIQTNIDRKDVGVSLELTPEVLEDKRVKLDIRTEISSVVATAQSVTQGLGPTTNKREATTSIIVPDQQTLVIGGLIRDDYVKSENKVPFLGDIPILGWLFKYQSKNLDKTNLMIFLTPHIIREPDQLNALKENKVDKQDEFIQKNKMEKPDQSRKEILDGRVHLPSPE
ncbi:MAG: secretin N-terminal domain-containing protein [Nitrospiria bacterium]